VHHYYGTKENLLDAATTPPQAFLEQIITAWQTPPAELRTSGCSAAASSPRS
jgi:hypothetical protein